MKQFKSEFWDVLAIAGIVLIVTGLWLLNTSLGMISLGVAVIIVACLGAKMWHS